MLRLLRHLWAFSLLLALGACAELPDYPNSADGNFQAVWQAIDEHYCYIGEKGLDWDGVRRVYEPRAAACKTPAELFTVCAQMLDTLRDGHVNLISPSVTSYYKKWWTDYPQDFNLRTVQEHYLHFAYLNTGGMMYAKLAGGRVGYIYYPSFSVMPGQSSLDGVLEYFRDCDALILDIRDNGGGLLTAGERLVARFINRKMTGAYIRHKTGPGHDDFSEPYPVEYEPAEPGRVRWEKPVAVLTNRSCFSAANDFVCVMSELPQVTVIGARTGGGGGMPFSTETPCGWGLRFSACPVTDVRGRSIEEGIEPTAGCEVHCTPWELADGRDAILDFALARFAPQSASLLRR